MKYFLIQCLAFVLVPLFSFAGEPAETGGEEEAETGETRQLHDMTEVDITAFEQVDVDQLSVMGIHLGSTISQVRNVVNNRFELVLKQDKFNNNRFYLYDESQNDDQVLLAYFKWPHADSTMDELILYPGIAKYLEGKSKQLVTKAAMNFENGVGKHFLGYPLNKEVILDVASVGLKHTAYFYKDQRYQVIKQVKKDEVKYSFGLYSADANLHQKGE